MGRNTWMFYKTSTLLNVPVEKQMHVPHIQKLLNVPVEKQMHVPHVQKGQKHTEVPQELICQWRSRRMCLMSRRRRNTLKSHTCSASPKIVDNLVLTFPKS